VTMKQTPIVHRYIDWSFTVPLQMNEFYCILKALKPDLGAGFFWRLLELSSCLPLATWVKKALSTHGLALELAWRDGDYLV